MSKPENLTPRPPSIHFTALSVTAMVSCTVLAVAVYVTLPMLVGATVDALGFSSRQAGLIASADMMGATLSSLIASIYVPRGRWRAALGGAIGLLVIADWFSGQVTSFGALFACRILAGLGEGVLLAIGNASIGETRKPDRIYGFATAAQLAFGAAALFVLPWLLGGYGLRGVFRALAGLAALQFSLIRCMPDAPRVQETSHTAKRPLSRDSLLGLGGVLSYFIAVGGIWSYLERMGAEKHIDTANVSLALSISSIAGLTGALIASWLEIKFGRLRPLAIGALLTVASLLLLEGSVSFASYAAVVSLFNFAWNLSVPYQFGALAEIDLSRRTVAMAGLVAFGGLTLGPIFAGALIHKSDFIYVDWMSIFFCLVSLGLFAAIYGRLRWNGESI